MQILYSFLLYNFITKRLHQTIYIDIDEEITSIVDRLKKVRTDEAVIVVPKRAMLIQSIVNLKLLKKEAENLELQIMIVTQDKLGKMLVEKAGILAQNKLDDVEGEEEILYEKEPTEKIVKGKEKKEKKNKELGSDSYFSEPQPRVMTPHADIDDVGEKEEFEKLVNTELVTDISDNIKEKKGIFSRSSNRAPVPMDMVRNFSIEEGLASPGSSKKSEKKTKNSKMAEEDFEQTNDEELNKINNFFNHNYHQEDSRPKTKRKAGAKDVHVSGKFWKFFLMFGTLAAAIVLLLCAFLFLPKAQVSVITKGKVQSIDLDAAASMGKGEVDYQNEIIPGKEIVIEKELSKTFSASRKKSVSNQKARGVVTIYNEYSTSPQPLVATTRFLSEDKKLFRLISGVTIPGMTKQGDEVKPGVIEAEVIADEAGEEYNIKETKFTIPGFESSGVEKYAKIYAKSTKAMSGGGNSSEQVSTISENDISSAKSKVLTELNAEIFDRLKEEAGEEWMVLEDAFVVEEPTYKISNLTGDAVDNFTVTVKAKASTIAFKEDDVKSLAASLLMKSQEAKKIDNGEISLEFGKSELEMKNSSLNIKVHASGKIRPSIDLENLKVGILGKSEEQLKAYLGTYSEIESAEVEYWPSFISGKIPAYASRVEVTLDKKQPVY